ncbi:Regulator of G-protein signaling 20 [Schistosoma japonicum]|nr:Regulator of G-protein signaling 20 [Schistosoma japonicum]
MGNRQKSTSALPSSSIYEIRPNTPGELSEYKHESYDPLTTINDKLCLISSNFYHDNLHIITPNQYSINYMTNIQYSSKPNHVYHEFNRSNPISLTNSTMDNRIPVTTVTTTTYNNNNSSSITSSNNHVQNLNYPYEKTFTNINQSACYCDRRNASADNNNNTTNYISNNSYTKSFIKTNSSHSESMTEPLQRISLCFTNDTQNNDNDNDDVTLNKQRQRQQQQQQTKSIIRNSIPGYSILRGSLKSYISEATYKTSGNRGIKTVNHQRTVSMPIDSTNSCQASLIQSNKATKTNDEHCNTITEHKNTGESETPTTGTVGNELPARRSLNSNNASQIITDPRSRTCCFCWCCCCSCSCMRVRTNLGESKRPSASNDPQAISDYQITDDKITLEELERWAESFDILMRSSNGQKTFREFLRSEYSEENIMFWLACEDIRKESNLEIVEEKARIIYEDFISILSPREVRIDVNPYESLVT